MFDEDEIIWERGEPLPPLTLFGVEYMYKYELERTTFEINTCVEKKQNEQLYEHVTIYSIFYVRRIIL